MSEAKPPAAPPQDNNCQSRETVERVWRRSVILLVLLFLLSVLLLVLGPIFIRHLYFLGYFLYFLFTIGVTAISIAFYLDHLAYAWNCLCYLCKGVKTKREARRCLLSAIKRYLSLSLSFTASIIGESAKYTIITAPLVFLIELSIPRIYYYLTNLSTSTSYSGSMWWHAWLSYVIPILATVAISLTMVTYSEMRNLEQRFSIRYRRSEKALTLITSVILFASWLGYNFAALIRESLKLLEFSIEYTNKIDYIILTTLRNASQSSNESVTCCLTYNFSQLTTRINSFGAQFYYSTSIKMVISTINSLAVAGIFVCLYLAVIAIIAVLPVAGQLLSCPQPHTPTSPQTSAAAMSAVKGFSKVVEALKKALRRLAAEVSKARSKARKLALRLRAALKRHQTN